MASGYVEYDGGRVWYQEAGEGPAVLLLHAGGADSRMWDGHLERFARAYRTIRIDLPGAGASPSAWSWRCQAVSEWHLPR
jgi:pimeloyl-ACP methyl ester carboxylesterase